MKYFLLCAIIILSACATDTRTYITDFDLYLETYHIIENVGADDYAARYVMGHQSTDYVLRTLSPSNIAVDFSGGIPELFNCHNSEILAMVDSGISFILNGQLSINSEYCTHLIY